MITYFKSQLELVKSLTNTIDNYWNLEMSEKDFVKYIKQVVRNNEELIFKDGKYTPALRQRLGVKRLRLIDKILEGGKNNER